MCWCTTSVAVQAVGLAAEREVVGSEAEREVVARVEALGVGMEAVVTVAAATVAATEESTAANRSPRNLCPTGMSCPRWRCLRPGRGCC